VKSRMGTKLLQAILFVGLSALYWCIAAYALLVQALGDCAPGATCTHLHAGVLIYGAPVIYALAVGLWIAWLRRRSSQGR